MFHRQVWETCDKGFLVNRPGKKNNIFVTLKFWKCTSGEKKRVNCDKLEIGTNCVNQIFNLNAFFFVLFTGATCYYHNIYFIYRLWRWHFCTFKDPNMAEILTNLMENLLKSWTPRSSWSFFLLLHISRVTKLNIELQPHQALQQFFFKVLPWRLLYQLSLKWHFWNLCSLCRIIFGQFWALTNTRALMIRRKLLKLPKITGQEFLNVTETLCCRICTIISDLHNFSTWIF